MKKLITSVLNARPEEEHRVILLLYQGFFTGIALASYDVGAVSVFLETFSEKVLAWAFVASGALGVILTYLYSVLQLRLKFKQLVTIYQILILVSSIILFIGIGYSDVFRFLAFILALPFTYIGLLIFWGTFNRLFDIKSAKRLIGGIDTGQLVASILSLFLLGFLLDRAIIAPVNLFEITAVFTFLALLIFLRTASKYELKRKTEKNEKDEAYAVGKIISHPYLRLMALFVIISMIAATFIDFAFLNVTKIQWKTEAEIGTFIAGFEATVVIFSFLFQTFVTDYIIDNFGLKAALIINPILILLLSIGALLTGLYVTQGGEFIWLFISVALVKLFVDSLRDALDGPSFKLYFLPVPSKIRFDINTKIEGVIASFAAMMAGIFLIIMDAYFPKGESGYNLIYLALLIVPVILIWFFTTRKMHNNYRSTLKDTLASQRDQKTVVKKTDEYVENNELIDLQILSKLDPSEFESVIKKLINSEDKKLSEYANKSMKFLDPDGDLILKDDTIKTLVSEALEIQSTSDLLGLNSNQLYTLSKSREEGNRILVTKLMLQKPDEETIFILNNLLRDVSNEVKKNALITARKLRRPETFPVLIDLLDDQELDSDASMALTKSGNSALPILTSVFNRGDTERSTQIKIAKIICDIGTKEAQKVLWDIIDFPDRRVFDLIIEQVSQKKFKISDNEVKHVNQLIENQIYKSIWNLAAESELSDSPENKEVIDALKFENEESFERIFKLLGILYEHESLQLVKDNLEIGSRENNTYALELLDLFISSELKMKLFPLLEDSDFKEKLTKLQEFFSRVSFTESQTLNFIVSKNLLDINRWTRACALRSILQSQNDLKGKVPNVVIGQVFNHDQLIFELAALIVNRHEPDRLKEILKRAPDKNRARILRMLDDQSDKINLLTQFDKVLSLCEQDLFQSMPKYYVSLILGIGKEVSLRKNKDIYIELPGSSIITILNGDLEIHKEEEVINLKTGDSSFIEYNRSTEIYLNPMTQTQLLIVDWNELITEFSYSPKILKVLTNNLRKTFKSESDLIEK